MTDINLFPHIDALSDDLCLLAIKPDTGLTGHFTVGELKAYYGATGGGGEEPEPENAYDAAFLENGDDNGALFWIATEKGTQPWVNPHLSGKVIVSMSSAYSSGHDHPDWLVDRQANSEIATGNTPNSWYQVNLKDYELQGYGVLIRARDYPANNPKSWSISASHDGVDFVQLASVLDTPLGQSQWAYTPTPNQPEYFQYWRVTQIGVSTSNDNIFCVAEIELYGKLRLKA
jgi:hypothetical protein